MDGLTFRRFGWCALAGLVAVGACNREPAVPAAESQAASPVQTTNQPINVKGCLRAGDASDTFVLTADKAETGAITATYQLQPQEGVRLIDHVGRLVEVNGTLLAQQEVTTRSTARPAEDKAKGTTGTPTVSTSTELELKRMNVQQVRRIGECPDKD